MFRNRTCKIRLITFSGIDGSGKSTYCKSLLNALKEQGIGTYYIWNRGGYSNLLEKLKRVLRKCLPLKIPDTTDEKGKHEFFKKGFTRDIWTTLIILDLIRETLQIRWKISANKVVLCDRYIYDTFVDLSVKFPDIVIEKKWLWRFLKAFSPKPDLQYFLDIPVEVSVLRKSDNWSVAELEHRATLYRRIIQERKLYTKDSTRDFHSLETEIISEVLACLSPGIGM